MLGRCEHPLCGNMARSPGSDRGMLGRVEDEVVVPSVPLRLPDMAATFILLEKHLPSCPLQLFGAVGCICRVSPHLHI